MSVTLNLELRTTVFISFFVFFFFFQPHRFNGCRREESPNENEQVQTGSGIRFQAGTRLSFKGKGVLF